MGTIKRNNNNLHIGVKKDAHPRFIGKVTNVLSEQKEIINTPDYLYPPLQKSPASEIPDEYLMHEGIGYGCFIAGNKVYRFNGDNSVDIAHLNFGENIETLGIGVFGTTGQGVDGDTNTGNTAIFVADNRADLSCKVHYQWINNDAVSDQERIDWNGEYQMWQELVIDFEDVILGYYKGNHVGSALAASETYDWDEGFMLHEYPKTNQVGNMEQYWAGGADSYGSLSSMRLENKTRLTNIMAGPAHFMEFIDNDEDWVGTTLKQGWHITQMAFANTGAAIPQLFIQISNPLESEEYRWNECVIFQLTLTHNEGVLAVTNIIPMFTPCELLGIARPFDIDKPLTVINGSGFPDGPHSTSNETWAENDYDPIVTPQGGIAGFPESYTGMQLNQMEVGWNNFQSHNIVLSPFGILFRVLQHVCMLDRYSTFGESSIYGNYYNGMEDPESQSDLQLQMWKMQFPYEERYTFFTDWEIDTSSMPGADTNYTTVSGIMLTGADSGGAIMDSASPSYNWKNYQGNLTFGENDVTPDEAIYNHTDIAEVQSLSQWDNIPVAADHVFWDMSSIRVNTQASSLVPHAAYHHQSNWELDEVQGNIESARTGFERMGEYLFVDTGDTETVKYPKKAISLVWDEEDGRIACRVGFCPNTPSKFYNVLGAQIGIAESENWYLTQDDPSFITSNIVSGALSWDDKTMFVVTSNANGIKCVDEPEASPVAQIKWNEKSVGIFHDFETTLELSHDVDLLKEGNTYFQTDVPESIKHYGKYDEIKSVFSSVLRYDDANSPEVSVTQSGITSTDNSDHKCTLYNADNTNVLSDNFDGNAPSYLWHSLLTSGTGAVYSDHTVLNTAVSKWYMNQPSSSTESIYMVSIFNQPSTTFEAFADGTTDLTGYQKYGFAANNQVFGSSDFHDNTGSGNAVAPLYLLVDDAVIGTPEDMTLLLPSIAPRAWPYITWFWRSDENDVYRGTFKTNYDPSYLADDPSYDVVTSETSVSDLSSDDNFLKLMDNGASLVTSGASASGVTISIDSGLTSASDMNFQAPFEVHYKTSFLYDGFQETPLNDVQQVKEESTNSKKSYNITVTFAPLAFSKRVTHINLYRKYIKTDGTGDIAYKFVTSKRISPLSAFTALPRHEYAFTTADANRASAAYESMVGISETLPDASIRYGLSAISDSYLFATNVTIPRDLTGDYANYIFRSMPNGRFSQFNWPVDYVRMEDEIVAIETYNGRLYAFATNRTFVLNQATLEVEAKFEGVGCISDKSIISTQFGLCWADHSSIYLLRESVPEVISAPIAVFGDLPESYTGVNQLQIGAASELRGWQESADKQDVHVTFESKRKSFLIFFTHTAALSPDLCWAYNIIRKRWDLLESPCRVYSTYIARDGQVILAGEVNGSSKFWSFMGDPFSRKSWAWWSKDLPFNGTTQEKSLSNVKIESNSANLGMTYNTLLYMNKENIYTSSTGITVTDSNSGNIFTRKLEIGPGWTTKKFKTLQVRLENISGNTEVSSIGVIYRPKRVK